MSCGSSFFMSKSFFFFSQYINFNVLGKELRTLQTLYMLRDENAIFKTIHGSKVLSDSKFNVKVRNITVASKRKGVQETQVRTFDRLNGSQRSNWNDHLGFYFDTEGRHKMDPVTLWLLRAKR